MKRRRIGGAVYILPNLLTTGNLFWGFFSIIKSLQGQFGWAASAILLAAVFDVLDGRVARLTKGTSEFGVQYDSLCDLLSFGLAPAFLMYQFGLDNLGRLGWIASFTFLACGALRLARFNVQSSIGKGSGDFTGLPIPMAALVIACFVALMTNLQIDEGGKSWLTQKFFDLMSKPKVKGYFLLGTAFFLGLAMVSNFVYRSHKVLKIRVIRPFKLLSISVFVLAVLAYEPEVFGFVLAALYALSGPFEWLVGWKKLSDDDEIFHHDEDQSIIEAGGGKDSGDDEQDGGDGKNAPGSKSEVDLKSSASGKHGQDNKANGVTFLEPKK
jgi:CDP-diacylglycerol---serine O-phosphatidyltransferase